MFVKETYVADNGTGLTVLIDNVPSIDSLVWQKKQHGIYVMYLATTPDGYAMYMCADPTNTSGCFGRTFELRMVDGSVDVVVGPWSSRAGIINKVFEQQIVEVLFKPNYRSVAITIEAAREEFAKHGTFIKDETYGHYTFSKT